RNNDIYNVYIDINKIIKDNNFIEEIEMRKNGSPYGDLISYEIIDYEKIDNINYYLKIKNTIIFYFSLIMAMLFVVIFFDDIKSFVCKETNRTFVNIILIVYILFLMIYLSFILFNNFGYKDIKYFILFNILLCAFINNLYTKNSTLKNILNILFLILFSISKNISLIHNTQLWAEDGRIFLQQYIDIGINSLFIEYAGYYHLLPRILTIISFNLSKILTNTITLTPLFMNLFAIIIGICLISYIFLSKECKYISNYNLRVLLSFLIISIPFSPEIFFNLTNLHWILSYFMFLTAISILYNNKLPNYFISISIFIFSLSSVYGIFISLSVFIYLLSNLLKEKNILTYIKKINIHNILKIFILNIGVVIQLYNILFSGRVNSEKSDLILNILYMIYAVSHKIFILNDMINIYCTIIIILLFLLLIVLIPLIINLYKNKIYLYIIMFMFLSILVYCSGQTIETTTIILNSVKSGGRYVFVTGTIMLTFIIYAYDNIIIINKSKFIFLYKVIILLISINFLLNINNINILTDMGWNKLSKYYNPNSTNIIEIPINPNGWIIKIPGEYKEK
ncbi:hypothetical protein SU46_08795, partial [Brachyspira hyodysenteriae]